MCARYVKAPKNFLFDWRQCGLGEKKAIGQTHDLNDLEEKKRLGLPHTLYLIFIVENQSAIIAA